MDGLGSREGSKIGPFLQRNCKFGIDKLIHSYADSRASSNLFCLLSDIHIDEGSGEEFWEQFSSVTQKGQILRKYDAS